MLTAAAGQHGVRLGRLTNKSRKQPHAPYWRRCPVDRFGVLSRFPAIRDKNPRAAITKAPNTGQAQRCGYPYWTGISGPDEPAGTMPFGMQRASALDDSRCHVSRRPAEHPVLDPENRRSRGLIAISPRNVATVLGSSLTPLAIVVSHQRSAVPDPETAHSLAWTPRHPLLSPCVACWRSPPTCHGCVLPVIATPPALTFESYGS